MCVDLIVQPGKVWSFSEHQTTVPIPQREEPACNSASSRQRWGSFETPNCTTHQSAQLGDGYTKINSKYQDLKEEVAEAVWFNKSRWFQEELRKGEMQPTEGGDGELGGSRELNQVMQVEDEKKVLTASKIQRLGYDFHSGKAAALVASLKACAKRKDLDEGCKLHAEIMKMRLHEKSLYIGSALISMYAQCGALEKAQEIFDELPERNVVSWNALISSYVQHGQGGRALNCFEQMRRLAFPPDRVTLSCILKACGSLGALDKGQEIHTYIASNHLFEQDVLVSTALVDMYVKCGALEKAQEVFNKVTNRNVVSWTALIAGYAQNGHGKEALNCFEHMQLAGVSPNAITFACVLKACGSVRDLRQGEQIHAQIVEERLLDKHIVVANAVVDMYAKCGALEKAQGVFDKLLVRDVISWNVLITGYVQQGHGEEALKYFDLMLSGGFTPNAITCAAILKACGSIGALDKGQEVHGQLMRQSLYERNTVVANALVGMYAKIGALEKAEELICEVQTRDVVSWTALIAGYVQNGRGEEALGCYERMQREGLFPDAITFACIIKACGDVGCISKGHEIHANIVRHGLLESVMGVCTALVNMYANFGLLAEAQELFNTSSIRDVASWSALMVGYSQLGNADVVFLSLQKMIEEGTNPDLITLTVILNTCCHEGCLEKGQMYFEILIKRYGILQHPDHYTCTVDLFGRAGHLFEAIAVVAEMPLSANLSVWVALLDGCRKWGNIKLGNWVFEHTIRLDELDHEAYAFPSNIYAAAGRIPHASRSKAMSERSDGSGLRGGLTH